MSGHMERHPGRGMSGAALLHPPQVQYGPSTSAWRQAGPDGRIGPPLRGGWGETALAALPLTKRPRGGWTPNLCPGLQPPLCWVTGPPLPFVTELPSWRVTGSPSSPAPSLADGGATGLPGIFLGPSKCCLRTLLSPRTLQGSRS